MVDPGRAAGAHFPGRAWQVDALPGLDMVVLVECVRKKQRKFAAVRADHLRIQVPCVRGAHRKAQPVVTDFYRYIFCKHADHPLKAGAVEDAFLGADRVERRLGPGRR